MDFGTAIGRSGRQSRSSDCSPAGIPPTGGPHDSRSARIIPLRRLEDDDEGTASGGRRSHPEPCHTTGIQTPHDSFDGHQGRIEWSGPKAF